MTQAGPKIRMDWASPTTQRGHARWLVQTRQAQTTLMRRAGPTIRTGWIDPTTQTGWPDDTDRLTRWLRWIVSDDPRTDRAGPTTLTSEVGPTTLMGEAGPTTRPCEVGPAQRLDCVGSAQRVRQTGPTRQPRWIDFKDTSFRKFNLNFFYKKWILEFGFWTWSKYLDWI